ADSAAAANLIHFELVSPEKKLVSEPVRMAVVPGEEGEFGAQAGHMSLLASLRPGVIALYREGEAAPQRIFITGGFADVTAEICTVLAEEAVDVKDLDRASIEQELKNLNEDLGMAKDEKEKNYVLAKMKLAQAKLQAV